MKILKWIAIIVIIFIAIGLLIPNKEDDIPNLKSNSSDIEVVKTSETVDDMMNTVHVEVKNNTSKLLVSGFIKIVYEDAQGKIVGTGNGTILNLASGSSKVIDCIAMGVEGYTNYRVEVSPMIYE